MAAPRLDDQLCFALHATTRAVVQAYRPFLEPLGITYTQYLTLLVLWERDGLLVGEIGERLEMDSGTLTPLLKRLESEGLLERRRQDVDQRQVRIHLSRKGRALGRRASTIPEEMVCRYTGGDPRSIANLVHLRDSLNELRRGLPEG